MTTSSLGIGAGLDLNSVLTKLMDVERQPLTVLKSRISETNTKLSKLGSLKSKLSDLQAAANTLYLPSKLSALSASSSDTTIATATAAFNASAGSYALVVSQLAAAQKSFSNAFNGSATFGQGKLTVTINGTGHDIDLTDQATYSLQDVRSKINAANIGVTATIISGASGDRLVLTGSTTGATGAFSLSVTNSNQNGATNDLVDLATFDIATPGLARATAQDATLSVDGVAITSSSNTLTTAVAGVTISLQKAGSSTLTVKTDNDRIVSAAQAFVDAFNAVTGMIKVESAFNTTTRTASPFNGDASVRNIQGVLSSTRTTVPAELSTASYKTLSEIGISIQQDGSLKLDASKLLNAIGTSTSDVMATLNAYGKAFSDATTSILDPQGLVSSRINGLNLSLKSYNENVLKLEARIAVVEARYRKQFTALDTLVSRMQTTSSYLAQQLTQTN